VSCAQGVASGYHTLERYAVGSKGRSSVEGRSTWRIFLGEILISGSRALQRIATGYDAL
jgi:hypothetical protein